METPEFETDRDTMPPPAGDTIAPPPSSILPPMGIQDQILAALIECQKIPMQVSARFDTFEASITKSTCDRISKAEYRIVTDFREPLVLNLNAIEEQIKVGFNRTTRDYKAQNEQIKTHGAIISDLRDLVSTLREEFDDLCGRFDELESSVRLQRLTLPAPFSYPSESEPEAVPGSAPVVVINSDGDGSSEPPEDGERE